MNRFATMLLRLCIFLFLAPLPNSAVTIRTVLVGNPGNAADPADGDLQTPGVQNFGNVDYTYRIGTYEVTNAEYAEFLNAKDPAGANQLGLWKSQMMTHPQIGGIGFSGSNPPGSKYILIEGKQNHPVPLIAWYDAIRFANWLNNGQGNGDTESGAYTLLGATPTPSNASSITRNPGATIFLPSENEWYKAAYYDPIASSYFHYATSSNSPPIASGPSVLANHANYLASVSNLLTDVGAYAGTTSPYGAFDMNGSLWEWNEVMIGSRRGLRGGGFGSQALDLSRLYRYDLARPNDGNGEFGFRVATVPEPSTIALAAFGALGLLIAARRKR